MNDLVQCTNSCRLGNGSSEPTAVIPAKPNDIDDAGYLLPRFLGDSGRRKGLHLSFNTPEAQSFGKNWLKISLDTIERSAREACRVTLDLEDESFDMAYCSTWIKLRAQQAWWPKSGGS